MRVKRYAVVRRDEECLRRIIDASSGQNGCPSPTLDIYPSLEVSRQTEEMRINHWQVDALFLPTSNPLTISSAHQDQDREDVFRSNTQAITLFNIGLACLDCNNDHSAEQLFHCAHSILAPQKSHIITALELYITNSIAKSQLQQQSPGKPTKEIQAWFNLARAFCKWQDGLNNEEYTEKSQTSLSASDTLSLMGQIHYSRGEHETALHCCRQVLYLRQSIHSDKHIKVAATHYNIALILQNLDQYRDALEHCVQFVRHPDIRGSSSSPRAYAQHSADALTTLGMLYFEVCSTSESIKALQEVIECRKSAYAVKYTILACDLLWLGRALQ